MSKLVVAVCEADDVYRNRFVTYIVEHRAEEISVFAFSEADLFLNELAKKKFDAAVLGNGFQEMEIILREQKVPSLILTEVMPEKTIEPENCVTEENCVKQVFRYQSMESLLHEIQIVSGQNIIPNTSGGLPQSGLEVIGVYSPIKHEMQMMFSMVFAAFMSEKRKVLYMNLMEYSGFLELFALPGEYDIGEIIIRLRNHRMQQEVFYRSVYEMEQICYIPPFHNPENLHEFKLEDFLLFLDFVKKETDFEMLLIDFGEGFERFTKMLETCSGIYLPIKTGYFYECRTEQFLEHIEASNQGIREKLHFVELPYSGKRIRGGSDVLRQVIFSEFGDDIRGYLTGTGYENK